MFVFCSAGALAASAGSTTANIFCESILKYTIVLCHAKHHVNECYNFAISYNYYYVML